MKKCKHNWNITCVVWRDGIRAFPCKKCGALLRFGTIKISKGVKR